MKKIVMITSLALLSTFVYAENNGEAHNLWKLLDIDKDGMISKNEGVYSKQVFENWDSLDINRDGRLDVEEFSKMFPELS